MKYLFLLTFLFGCLESSEYFNPIGRFKAGDEVVVINPGDFYQGCTGVISFKAGYYQRRSECQMTNCDARYEVSNVRCKNLLLKGTFMVQDHAIELIK